MVEEDEGVKYPILDDKMNQLPVLTDLFQQINETCDTYDLYDNASYELQGLEVKFLARINVLDKIWTVLLKAKQIRKIIRCNCNS